VPHLGDKTLKKQILGPSILKKRGFWLKIIQRFLVKTDIKFEFDLKVWRYLDFGAKLVDKTLIFLGFWFNSFLTFQQVKQQ
jgi:hypothetical protein